MANNKFTMVCPHCGSTGSYEEFDCPEGGRASVTTGFQCHSCGKSFHATFSDGGVESVFK